MNEEIPTSLEQRSRDLFDESVGNVNMRVRSRLNLARHTALEAAARPRARFFRLLFAAPAAGVCAAALLAVAVWVGVPHGEKPKKVILKLQKLEH